MRFGDQDALTVQISEAGVVRTLRTLLDRLDAQGADVAGLTVHTPDLDDVFLTLTDTDTATDTATAATTKEPIAATVKEQESAR